MLRVSVWRGDAGGGMVDYRAPRRANQTVLDVVTWLQRNVAPGLSYRFACRVGMCGSCAMMVNGAPRWTCRTHVKAVARDGAIAIAPLRNLPVVKDLVCDMSVFFDKWQRAEGRFVSDESFADDNDNNITNSTAITNTTQHDNGNIKSYTDNININRDSDINKNANADDIKNSTATTNTKQRDNNNIKSSADNININRDDDIIKNASADNDIKNSTAIANTKQRDNNNIKNFADNININRGDDIINNAGNKKNPTATVATKQRAEVDAAIECINCAVCYAACDVVAWSAEYLGPAALNRAWSLQNDSRDRRHDKRLRAISAAGGCQHCHSQQSCSHYCPVGLSPARSIAGLKRMLAGEVLRGRL